MAVHTGLLCVLSVLVKGVRRHGDNGQTRLFGIRKSADGTRSRITVHDRHLNIHQHQIIIPGRALAHLVYRDLSVFRRVHLEPAFLEHRHRDFAVEGVILDDQQPFSPSAPQALPKETAQPVRGAART